MAKKVKFL